MSQIPILSGISVDPGADFRVSLPRNLIPVPGSNGIANGYLRTAEGITRFDRNSTLSGIGRGGINWKNELYRVIGSKLVKISAAGDIMVLGDVGDDGKPVTLDYSFDRLAIASGQHLYYFKDGILTLVTDVDLGVVVDMLWMDGYFITTDGTNIVITELNDPTAVDPLKYGSSEADPDPIVALLKLREELFALNRYTIEVFDNVGGSNFPFQRNLGAMIEKGCVGTHACCVVDQSFAFLGSAKDEAPSVYLGGGGQAAKIATREVEDVLATYSEDELATAIVETRGHRRHVHLYVTLPRDTLVYDIAASNVLGTPVWFFLSSSDDAMSPYRARNFVYCYSKWTCDDRYDNRIGQMDTNLFTQYGDDVGWQFDTSLLYNNGDGVIMHSLELVGLPGRAALNTDPVMFLSWTQDGLTWGDERLISLGKTGQRNKRMAFRPKTKFRNWLGIRYRGVNAAIVAFTRLEAQLEALNG